MGRFEGGTRDFTITGYGMGGRIVLIRSYYCFYRLEKRKSCSLQFRIGKRYTMPKVFQVNHVMEEIEST